MSGYSIALFLHLVGVLALFAGIGLEQTGLRQLRNAPSLAQVREWIGLMRGLRRLDAPAGLTILVSGGYLAEHGAGHHAWVAAGIVGMVLMAVLGEVTSTDEDGQRCRSVEAAQAPEHRHPLANLGEGHGIPQLAQASLFEADAGEERQDADEMEEERDGICGHDVTRGLGSDDGLRPVRGASSSL